jgi:transmembrane sensor
MKEDIDEILSRILSGNADSDDFLALNEWLSLDEENRMEFKLLKSYWDSKVYYNGMASSLSSIDRVWSHVKLVKKESKRKLFLRWLAPIAACITLLLIVGTYFMVVPKKTTTVHYYTYMSGQFRTTIRLKDGSKVILNKNSRLTYTNGFEKDLRFVELTGEAFFSVTKDALHPFVVSVNNSQIRVLGTKFNVLAFARDKVVVTLLEGSVSFTSGRRKIIMKPNEQLICKGINADLVVKPVETDSICAWKDGLFKYKSIELSELIKNLETRFAVKIQFKDHIHIDTMEVTASFKEGQSIEDILNVISRTLPIHWNKENGIYIIKD